MAKDPSPFHGTDFHSIGDIYTKQGVLFGLKRADGTILVNFDHSTSYGTLKQIARITQCELIQVHGTWTFLPNKETTINDDEEDYIPDPSNSD